MNYENRVARGYLRKFSQQCAKRRGGPDIVERRSGQRHRCLGGNTRRKFDVVSEDFDAVLLQHVEDGTV